MPTYGSYWFEYLAGIHPDIRWVLNCTEDKNFCGKILPEMHGNICFAGKLLRFGNLKQGLLEAQAIKRHLNSAARAIQITTIAVFHKRLNLIGSHILDDWFRVTLLSTLSRRLTGDPVWEKYWIRIPQLDPLQHNRLLVLQNSPRSRLDFFLLSVDAIEIWSFLSEYFPFFQKAFFQDRQSKQSFSEWASWNEDATTSFKSLVEKNSLVADGAESQVESKSILS